MKVRTAFQIEGGVLRLEVGFIGANERAKQSYIDILQILSAKMSPDLIILQEYAGLLRSVLGQNPPPDVAVCIATLGRTIASLINLPQRSARVHMQFECDG